MHFNRNIFVFVLLLALLVISGGALEAKTPKESHVEVALRMIGHELLLQAGDSSSRVLPIKQFVNEYQIRFESDLAIVPDSLLAIVKRVTEKSELPEAYLLQVLTCDSNEVVYAFEVGTTEGNTIIPCAGRLLPKSCYYVSFTDMAVTAQGEESVTNSPHWLGIIFSVLALILSSIAIFWYRKSQRKSKSNPHVISIGKYNFDKLNSELIIAEQRIELTSKEADLLLLLYETANQTVEREVLLNKVWGDEGDYIGRTLDVFISKLRKKLEFDEQLKIVNVRGVGYKLVVLD